MNEKIKTAQSILELIEELEIQIRDNDRSAMQSTVNALKEAGLENYNNVKELVDQFDKLRELPLSDNDRILVLNQNLDEVSKYIGPKDRKDYEGECKDDFPVVWELLDSSSKEFLITARYLKYACMMMRKVDYSPVILEFCRVFENELQTKIYNDYISEVSKPGITILDFSNNCDSIKNAVRKKRSNKPYFISANEMISYLEDMRGLQRGQNGYIPELKKYLESEKWDTIKLSDSTFGTNSHNYFDRYRNNAAHPNLNEEKKAEQCREKTKRLVTQFIQCRSV